MLFAYYCSHACYSHTNTFISFNTQHKTIGLNNEHNIKKQNKTKRQNIKINQSSEIFEQQITSQPIFFLYSCSDGEWEEVISAPTSCSEIYRGRARDAPDCLEPDCLDVASFSDNALLDRLFTSDNGRDARF